MEAFREYLLGYAIVQIPSKTLVYLEVRKSLLLNVVKAAESTKYIESS